MPADSEGAFVFPLQVLERSQQPGVGISDDWMIRNGVEQFCVQCVCGIEVVGVFVIW